MTLVQSKYLPYLLLLLFSIPLFFLNIHDVHFWGDDFAQYIKEAQNIATGKPFYQSTYIYNPYNTVYAPPQYPPGFPLLLAPVVKVWGLSIKAMCYFNTVIATCLLFALYAYFRKHTGTVAAICLSLLIIYSGNLIYLKQEVLSDVPCLLFITLYLLLRNNPQISWQRIVLLILCATMAVLIRTQAIFIVLAEGIYLLLSILKAIIKQRQFAIKSVYRHPSIYIVGGTLLLVIIMNKLVFYAPAATDSFYKNLFTIAMHDSLWHILKENLSFLFGNLAALFYFDPDDPLAKTLILFIGNVGMVFILLGFLISIRKRLSVDDIFFTLICLMIIFLHQARSQRYVLPILPIAFFYCYATAKTIIPAITKIDARVIAIVASLFYLSLDCDYLKTTLADPPDACIPRQKDYTAFKYISQHVNDSDIIVFPMPRALALYTNKKSINIAWEISQERNKQIFDSFRVKYILVCDDFGSNYFKDYFAHIQHPTDSAHIADTYTLYTLR